MDKSTNENPTPEDKASGQVLSLGCAICEQIVGKFGTPGSWKDSTLLGKVSNLLEGNCPHVEYLRNLKFMYGPVPNYEEEQLYLEHDFNDTVAFGCAYTNTWSVSSPMSLVARQDVANHPGRVLIVDEKWINGNLVRGWISNCNTDHGDRCKFLPLFTISDNIRPTYLVDTLQKCLVQGSQISEGYIAISYRWGQTRTFRNKTSNCQQLQQPGILTQDTIWQSLPQTIKDAFAVVCFLGGRYLWVDALCVVQDDNEHLMYETSRMHRIYACADFTIIAADGSDANYGLRGFKNLTAPREVKQVLVELAASEQLTKTMSAWRLGYKDDRRPENVYYDRAWTLQERIFSKRQLIFEKGCARWLCQCSVWYEDTLPDKRYDERPIDYGERWLYSPVPELRNISDLMMKFNVKKLTFPEDAFSAFSGMQSMLHRTYPSGLIFGLPELFFDIALTWRPTTTITRRIPSMTPRPNSLQHQVPSWSWIGWEGKIRFPDDHEFNVVATSVINIEGYTAPVTEWFAMESPSSKIKRQVECHWYTYKSLAQDSAATLPPGWRREAFDIESGLCLDDVTYHIHQFPREIPKFCYRHTTARSSVEFSWYPVPTVDISSSSSLQTQTAFVFAQTSRAFLYVGDLLESDSRFEELQVQLLDSCGKYVGHLRLNNREILAKLKTSAKENEKKLIELVATAKGYTGNIFDYDLAKRMQQETGERIWRTQVKDCYFVLWIEWEDGVAYRQSYGAVTVKAWEAEKESSLVDLILG